MAKKKRILLFRSQKKRPRQVGFVWPRWLFFFYPRDCCCVMISDLPQGIFSLVVAFSNRLAPLSHWKSERKTGTRVCATLRTWLSGWVQFMAVENSCRFRTWGPGVGRRRHVQKKERKKGDREREKRIHVAWFHSALSLTSLPSKTQNLYAAIFVCVFHCFHIQVTPGVVSFTLPFKLPGIFR